MESQGIFHLAVFLALAGFIEANNGVPVFVFGSQSLDIPKQLAGHTTKSEVFGSYLTLTKRPDVLVVFEQDELSSEDFLRFGSDMKQGVFRKLETYMKMKGSSYLPSVKNPVHSLRDLVQQYDDVIELENISGEATEYITKLKLKRNTAVIVHMNPTTDQEFLTRNLAGNDAVISNVMEHMKESGLTYTAVFTGKTHRRSSEAVMQASGRHLLAVSEDAADNKTIISDISNCTTFYAVNMVVDNKTINTQAMGKIKYNCSSVGENEGTVSMTFEGQKLTFKMIKAERYWSLDSVVLDGTGLTVESPGEIAFGAPVGMSYHCGERISLKQNETERVTFDLLQLQAFDNSGKFGNAFDCTPFFTIPIITGLLTVLLMVVVSCCGICMLGSVQTFDQYDDPKGKPLPVVISE